MKSISDAQPDLCVAFLHDHPREEQLIARMVLIYGQIEGALTNILAFVLGDIDPALRTLYKLRGEAPRIDVVQEICAAKMRELGIWATFDQAIAALKHCKLIRNQYAHCIWGSNGDLLVGDLTETAVQKQPNCTITFRRVPLDLVEEQAAYFVYTNMLLIHVCRLLPGSILQSLGKERPKPRPVRMPPRNIPIP